MIIDNTIVLLSTYALGVKSLKTPNETIRSLFLESSVEITRKHVCQSGDLAYAHDDPAEGFCDVTYAAVEPTSPLYVYKTT